jgi:hypothetical protein
MRRWSGAAQISASREQTRTSAVSVSAGGGGRVLGDAEGAVGEVANRSYTGVGSATEQASRSGSGNLPADACELWIWSAPARLCPSADVVAEGLHDVAKV